MDYRRTRLPVGDSALLADALLESLDDDAARNVQLKWMAEAEDRIEAYRRGLRRASFYLLCG